MPHEGMRRGDGFSDTAGYYDNYGLSLAGNWLLHAAVKDRAWLEKNVSRVLVVQIRDNVSQLSVNPEVDRPWQEKAAQGSRRTSQLAELSSRALEGVTTPLKGLFSARESVMVFRNDGQLEGVMRFFDQLYPARTSSPRRSSS